MQFVFTRRSVDGKGRPDGTFCAVEFLAEPHQRDRAADIIDELFPEGHGLLRFADRLRRQSAPVARWLFHWQLDQWPLGLSDDQIETARLMLVAAGFVDRSPAWEAA